MHVIPEHTMRVAFIAEQLMQEIPGGIGTYVRAMLRRLPSEGVQLEPFVAWHRIGSLAETGLPHARRLSLPRQALYRRWTSGHGPTPSGDAVIVHAPSVAFPPKDSRPLVVTVHDVAFEEHPETFPDAGREFHESMLSRIGEADIVIAPSKATADAIGDRHPRVRIVPMGTDMEPPPPEERAEILERLKIEKPYVLWIGTLEPGRTRKGSFAGSFMRSRTAFPTATS